MVSPASSRSASHSPAPARDDDQGVQGPKQPSALYSMVMTPVNLTVFLISLLIVDLHYSLARAENASGRAPGGLWPWLPAWLRRVALSLSGRGRTPYGPAPGSSSNRSGRRGDGSAGWHYHSKQKKLMRMEADEAFRMRGAVLAGLAVVGLVSFVVLWCAGSRVVVELGRVVAAVRR